MWRDLTATRRVNRGAEPRTDPPLPEMFGTPISTCRPSAFRSSDFEPHGLLRRGWGPQPWAVNSGVGPGRTLKLPKAKWVCSLASVSPQNWDAATSAQAARTQKRQCPRQGTWCPCPPHLGECSPVEPLVVHSLESEICNSVAFLPDTEEALWSAGARGRSGDGCSGGSGCCQVCARVHRTAIGITRWLILCG